jgi:hypothetical protein
MYSVISANRSSERAPKNWRVFEKQALEKYFGKVIDVNGEDGTSVLDCYSEYKDSIKYIRWYPDPELLSKEEYLGILKQSSLIGQIPYLINSPEGFINVQSKDEAFRLWKKNNINCPNYFTFISIREFFSKFEDRNIEYPFLIRLNNDVGGSGSYLVKNKFDLCKNLIRLIRDFRNHKRKNIGISTKMICVEYINTINSKEGVNVSYRIHVSGNKIISGYARISDSKDWVAITGKFTREKSDIWLKYNMICEELCRENEKEICKAVQSLNLNCQGVDLIIENGSNKLYFIEVQPTYASGYAEFGYCGYYPPFYNPSYPELVKFLIEEKKYLMEKIPNYYNNWLDKKTHFDLVYKNLAEYLNVRS